MVSAVDGVDASARAGEILGIVGESGSGKSVLLSAILRLVRPPGRIVSGGSCFEGNDLLALPAAELRRSAVRGSPWCSQTPRTSLNPLITVGRADRAPVAPASRHVDGRRPGALRSTC